MEQKKFDNKPLIESKVSLSKDGKWLIHRTTITDIKSVNFYNKVLEGALKVEDVK